VTHVTFGDPSAWENPPNPGHGCGFLVGDFESTRTRTHPTHTWVPARVCKPVTGPNQNLYIWSYALGSDTRSESHPVGGGETLTAS